MSTRAPQLKTSIRVRHRLTLIAVRHLPMSIKARCPERTVPLARSPKAARKASLPTSTRVLRPARSIRAPRRATSTLRHPERELQPPQQQRPRRKRASRYEACSLVSSGWFIASGLYYWLAVGFDLRTKFFVLIMAFVVAITARLGAGRAGSDVGLAAAGLFLVSVVLGNYLVEQKYYEDAYTSTQIQQQAAAEISIDGDYTDEEARRLLGFLPAEWDALEPDERQGYREEMHDEYQMAIYEGWDPKEFYTVDEEEAATLEPGLAFGTYFDNLILYLGFSGLFFIGLGCWEAYKIASVEA